MYPTVVWPHSPFELASCATVSNENRETAGTLTNYSISAAANSLECGADAVTETQHGETTDLDYSVRQSQWFAGFNQDLE